MLNLPNARVRLRRERALRGVTGLASRATDTRVPALAGLPEPKVRPLIARYVRTVLLRARSGGYSLRDRVGTSYRFRRQRRATSATLDDSSFHRRRDWWLRARDSLVCASRAPC